MKNELKQEQSEELFNRWLREGTFVKGGITYKAGINNDSAIKAMIPSNRKMIGKICNISSELTLTNADLEDEYHEGFTIGNGKKLYWLMLWHGSGHVTVYRKDNKGEALAKRWISGDTIITVHFK